MTNAEVFIHVQTAKVKGHVTKIRNNRKQSCKYRGWLGFEV